MTDPKDLSSLQKQEEIKAQGNPSSEDEAPKTPVAQVVETSAGFLVSVRGGGEGGEGGSPGENDSTNGGGRKKRSDRGKEDLGPTLSSRNGRISLFHPPLNGPQVQVVHRAPAPAKKPKKNAGVLHYAPKGEPTCPECGKIYASWKAVFGHLRAHKGRGYVGCFSHPKFTTEVGFPERGAVANSFHDLACQNLMRFGVEPGQEAAGSSSVKGIDFDLNEPPEGTGDCAGFDLNILPLPENE